MVENRGFHTRDGLFFRREPDGGVTVRKYGLMKDLPIFSITLDKRKWESVVASCCRRGETAQTFKEAQDFHQASILPPAHQRGDK